MLRVGLKLNGRLFLAASGPNRSEVRRALSLDLSRNWCILSNKKQFFLAPTSREYVNERFHSACTKIFRSRSTSRYWPWTPSCQFSHFTFHLDCGQESQVIRFHTRPSLNQFQGCSRFKLRDTHLSSIKCYRTQLLSTCGENSKGHRNQGQRFHDATIASALSISTLFTIYYLWKNVSNEENQLYTIALCQSQDSDSKVYFTGKSLDDKPQRSNSSTQFLSRTTSETQNGIYARSSGTVQGNVDETDAISFSQAAEMVDDLLEKRKAEIGSPGIVVCVSVDGKYVYAKGFGYADVENQVPIHPHSVIRIASISKSMTAAIVAKLVDEGKINLDESVYHYVPKFPPKDFKGEKVDITVRQLLSHTSGIRSYWLNNDPVIALQPKLDEIMSTFDAGIQNLFYSTLKTRSLPKKQTDKKEKENIRRGEKTSVSEFPCEYLKTEMYPSTTEALDVFCKDRLVAKPGTKFVYSTLAYTLLTAVIESVTRKSFASVVKETFGLWGMKESYLDQNDPLIYNRARHYQKKRSALINTPYIDVSYKWAGGGFLSSVMDIVKFGNILLYSSQRGDNDAGLPGYIKQSTIQEFWTSIENKRTNKKYGLGFELSLSKRAYGMCPIHSSGAGHSGWAIGASSDFFILPRLQAGNEERTDKSIKASSDTSRGSAQLSETAKPSSPHTRLTIPQGVVVAVMVNLIGVSVNEVTEEIAHIFQRVVFD